MCILFIAVGQHERFPLIIAANRDEFFARPTLPSHYWGTHPRILSGIDQQAGGTWMGINSTGHLAALTNIRNPQEIKLNPVSRGKLVADYLSKPVHQYEAVLQHSQDNYNGYNLLFGPWQDLKVYNNQLNQLSNLTNGFYGLSNASLNSPWPKINKGVSKLKEYCVQSQEQSHTIKDKMLFELLLDSSTALDEQLPQTGISIEWERKLSSIFVQGENYGTRSSTVLKIDTEGNVSWCERTFNSVAVCTYEKKRQFQIK